MGASAPLLGGVFGILIGLVSGYFGRAVDHILSRIIDTTLSFPSIIVAIAIVGVLRGGTQNIIIALGFAILPRFARCRHRRASHPCQPELLDPRTYCPGTTV